MRFSSLAVLAGFLAGAAIVPAQQYVFRAYRQADGLKSLAVRTLARDCDGYLWLGTENGVFRFLGSGFEHFGPEQGIAEFGIQEIATDSSCNLWVGTTRNLYRLQDKRFVPAAPSAIPVKNIHGMAAQDGRSLLVVDNGRLMRLEHSASGQFAGYTEALPADTLRAVPDLAHINSVSVVAGAGGTRSVWVGADGRLFTWQEQAGGANAISVQEWGKDQGLPRDHWESVVVDGAGTVWAEGWTHIAALSQGKARFVDHSVLLSAQGNFFLRSRMVVDREGRVLAPADGGIVRWQGNRWQTIDRGSGLPHNNQIGSMIFDNSGDLWIGSWGDGLYNWTGYEQWEGWSDDRQLPSPIVWAIDASRPERTVIGTDKGPAWVDLRNGTAGPMGKARVWTPGLIVAIGHDRGETEWAATNSGSVLQMNRNGAPTQTAKLPASIVSGFEDSAGSLFLGTDHGLYVRQQGAAKPVPVLAANALIEPGAWLDAGCQAPDGTDWFLSGNRLLREQNGKWSKPGVGGLPGTARGKLVALSCSPDGSLWATGPRIGTWRLTPAGEQVNAWNLPTPAEMGGQDSYAILADRRGWVWLGTGQGLLAWNGRSWRHLTQESGLLWNDVDEWGLSEGTDGSLWVGTSGGLAHLRHPERVFDPVPMQISITGIQRGDKAYPIAPGIDFPWSPLPLRLQLASPTVRNRSELVFKYQIEGLNSGWIESKDGWAVLSGVSPGSFTVLAEASNPGLGENSPVLKIDMLIRPPWWRKTSFLLFGGLALLLFVVIAARLYARHLRARSRHLEELVRQRTRELEASREQLRVQAMYDGLTGMLNRAAILSELATQMERARRDGKPLILALTDVDHFKNVNDAYGHLAGDEALRRFAGALRVAIRTYDSVGRYGGEEFLLVLADVPPELADSRVQHLHAAITNLRVRVGEAEIRITCSIGATVFDPLREAATSEMLLSIADQALYAAKAEGRNRVVMHRGEASKELSGGAGRMHREP